MRRCADAVASAPAGRHRSPPGPSLAPRSVARRDVAGGRGAVRRRGRLPALPHRRPAARPLAVHRGVRTPRRGQAAQRADGSGSLRHVAAEGRADASRQGLLREDGAREGDVPGAGDDPVLPRDLGRAPRGRGAAPEQAGPRHPGGAALRVGDGDRGPARRRQGARSGRLRPRDGRTAGGDARRAQRGRLRAQVHLHLDAGGVAVSRCAAAPRRARDGVPRDRALLSHQGRHDGAGRAGADQRALAPRGRTRQPRARRRGRGDDAGPRRLRAGAADPHHNRPCLSDARRSSRLAALVLATALGLPGASRVSRPGAARHRRTQPRRPLGGRPALQGRQRQRPARSVRGLAPARRGARPRSGGPHDARGEGRAHADRHAERRLRRRADAGGDRVRRDAEDEPLRAAQRGEGGRRCL